MAKFSAIAAVLFCLLTLSIARTQPENDDTTTTFLLPTETESESKSESLIAVPLIAHSFRPVNRRFRIRSKFPCHHHSKVDPTTKEHVEIPYGDDMLVASSDIPVLGFDHRRHSRIYHHYHDGKAIDSEQTTSKRMEIPYGDDMIVASGENSDFMEPGVIGGLNRYRHHRRYQHRHQHHEADGKDTDNDSDSDDENENENENEGDKQVRRYRKREEMMKNVGKHYKKKKDGFMNRVRDFFNLNF